MRGGASRHRAPTPRFEVVRRIDVEERRGVRGQVRDADAVLVEPPVRRPAPLFEETDQRLGAVAAHQQEQVLAPVSIVGDSHAHTLRILDQQLDHVLRQVGRVSGTGKYPIRRGDLDGGRKTAQGSFTRRAIRNHLATEPRIRRIVRAAQHHCGHLFPKTFQHPCQERAPGDFDQRFFDASETPPGTAAEDDARDILRLHAATRCPAV